MGHKKDGHRRTRKKERPAKAAATAAPSVGLEIVLKCDSAGCLEAISSAILEAASPKVPTSIIHAGVGTISKTDIFLAETGSFLILGFNVGTGPNIDKLSAEHGVEIRLYDVIYRLVDDVRQTALSLLPAEEAEEILGRAKVVALFKSSRKGIILGCEIVEGRLAVADRFRVIAAMGPVYTGTIGSLHIGHDAVRDAKLGQKVGLKIQHFKKAAIGDLVESFLPKRGESTQPWTPRGGAYRF
jgi:translation initiation factor IF-2